MRLLILGLCTVLGSIAFLARAGSPPALPPTTAPTTRITGKVIDANGKPIAGATVTRTVQRYTERPWRFEGVDVAETTTADANGAFSLEVPAFAPNDRRPLLITGTADGFAYESTHYNFDGTSAWFYNFTSRERTSECLLILRPAATVSGIVVDQDEVPVADVAVYVDACRPPVRTDENGRFTIDKVAPSRVGLYESFDNVRVDSPDFVADEARLRDVVAGQETKLVIKLDPGTLLSGIVRKIDGAAVENAEVRASAEIHDWTTSSWSTRTDADGRYQLRVPAEAKLDVAVTPPFPMDRDDPGLYSATPKQTFVAGAPRPSADFQLAPARRIRGRVVGIPDGFTGTLYVGLRAADANEFDLGYAQQAPVDADGSFRFTQLAPKSWTVDLTWHSSGKMRVLIGDRRVDLRQQSKDDLDLRVQATDLVDTSIRAEGRVVNADGTPANRAKLRLIPTKVVQTRGLPIVPIEKFSDANGTFAFESISKDMRWTLWASDADGEHGAATVIDPTSPPAGPIELKLAAGAAFSGRIVDDKGQPVAGVYVYLSIAVPAADSAADPPGMGIRFGDSRYTLRYAVTDNDGRYRIAGFVAPPGEFTYQLMPRLPNNSKQQQSQNGYDDLDVDPSKPHDGMDFAITVEPITEGNLDGPTERVTIKPKR